jgi:hypothetical protein
MCVCVYIYIHICVIHICIDIYTYTYIYLRNTYISCYLTSILLQINERLLRYTRDKDDTLNPGIFIFYFYFYFIFFLSTQERAPIRTTLSTQEFFIFYLMKNKKMRCSSALVRADEHRIFYFYFFIFCFFLLFLDYREGAPS